jgi:hypothetical protein
MKYDGFVKQILKCKPNRGRALRRHLKRWDISVQRTGSGAIQNALRKMSKRRRIISDHVKFFIEKYDSTNFRS